ncbi:CueP family metal-binding protein [Kocuria sp. SM24M-10]|uniref:CueP family metal-binding protein n=1 Tax=Kocuria sp. SM24M-10 TaxID=1660349 RepID=UPI00069AD9B5|nr:CueP family metal-binding protein [Kocuria sp. SM24M-10]
MRSWVLSVSAAALLLASGCAGGNAEREALLREHGLEGASTEEVVERLDRTHEDRAAGLAGSVTYDEVVLTDGGSEAVLPMPEDRFYLAVAPWTTTTHECFHHSLSGCQGELVGEEFDVRVADDAGRVLLDRTLTSYENGFVGLWLPKDITGTLEISSAAGTATQQVSTSADDPTCLTTLRLA